MGATRKVTVVCGECLEKFSYMTKANTLKTFCPVCSKRRIDASKRRSKESLSTREDRDLTDAEIEAKLADIPDREIGWDRYLSIFSRNAT